MTSYLNSINTDYIEELEVQYKNDPQAIDPTWKSFFDGLNLVHNMPAKSELSARDRSIQDLEFEIKALELIQGYRTMGHLIADVNPLERGIKAHPLLELINFGLSENDLERTCEVGQVLGLGTTTLRSIIEALKTFYCSPVSVEYGHIDDPKSRHWIQKRVESNTMAKPLPAQQKIRVLQKLTEAENLDTFLHRRFVGQKRFSAEGNDILIPMLDHMIQQACELGADEILIGMAHRGRLNVLANIFQKDMKVMLAEFSGNLDAEVGDGDVKYHMGFSQDTTSLLGKKLHLSLMPNPSHLEAVNPVLMGVTRSKQKLKGDKEHNKTLAILIHGDAAFSGQGIIYETLNMAQLEGYTIGGVIHLIVNNQVGFTTSPHEGRSTVQCTDIATMMEFPVFHVNADEPEPAMRCASLALQFRYKFKRDVIVDIVGYRRYGHNEGDEPTFTQPLMYRKINAHPRVRGLYAEKLVKEKLLDQAGVDKMVEDYTQKLEAALEEAKKNRVSPNMHAFGDRWKEIKKASDKVIFQKAPTAVAEEKLKSSALKLLEVPTDFHIHPKIQKFLDDRREMIEDKKLIDWSLGEALAYASLLAEGHSVRLAGQDAERGTFSHRHSVLNDVETGKKFCSLNNLASEQSDFEVINSLLSEYAALGFEFGQSLSNPRKLTIWEAQFGDFGNGAQIIIDQFLTSSAFKWSRHSGLVLLLPHGYEGQGPEHSSARLERFLQACGQNNIQVCNLTTPAQIFHALRRQLKRDFRLPLIIMSPKSLLRHPLVASSWKDFSEGQFQELIDDTDPTLKEKAKRLVICSGKIYYELLEARKSSKNPDVALLRVEQFYPFPKEEWTRILNSYKSVQDIIWCQEGPQNMEGWSFISQHLTPLIVSQKPSAKFFYVGRQMQASPADGVLSVHVKEQKRIVATALGDL